MLVDNFSAGIFVGFLGHIESQDMSQHSHGNTFNLCGRIETKTFFRFTDGLMELYCQDRLDIILIEKSFGSLTGW